MRAEKTACIPCSRNCGLEVTVDAGHLRAIRGDTPSHCDPIARTPYHEFVPVSITPRP